MTSFWLFYSVGIILIVCLGMSMIGNDDVGLEEVAAVVAIEVNSQVRWNAGQNRLYFTTQRYCWTCVKLVCY
jgi:hypothetical protein